MAETVTANSASLREALRLVPFDARESGTVARWVQSEQELLFLAPATTGPLTGAKVASWIKPGGRAFLLQRPAERLPIGYAELNPMRSDPGHLWLGHVVIRPDRRRCGLGRRFVEMLVEEAFQHGGAHRISLVVFPDNRPAIECYKRAGFLLVGEEVHQFATTGPRRRLLRYEIRKGVNRTSRTTPTA
ncbi:MAG: N-acetyltransferase [Phycisphaerales bacterium]|nr:MAG: N-acetyltransferase [Phycisphaerales bacterium]